MKLFSKKIFLVLVLMLGCLGLVACSKDEQSSSGTVKKNQRPQGNMVMKDEEGNTVITIDDIQSAETITNDDGNGTKEYCVSIKFTEDGTSKFAAVTEENIGKTLSIFVNDEVVSAPRIQTAITNGEAIITGYMQTYEECQKLVDLIYTPCESNAQESQKMPNLKITENDGTILVTEDQVYTFYCEAMDIGKGGSAVDVVVIEFNDDGKTIMAEKTKKLVGKEINLVIKGDLVYDCTLDEPISEGKWIIKDLDDTDKYRKVTEALSSVIN